MNRQLKFRIWNKQHKVWLENDASLHCFSNWSICPFTGKLTDYVGAISGDIETYSASPAPDYYTTAGSIVKESPYVIQQFTGLKDSNGKEIYEGDLINGCIYTVDPNFKKVLWGEITNREVFFQSGEYKCPPNERLSNIYKIRIVGNIFENTELLK